MNQDMILKIFYEEILPFASKRGVIEIDGISYNIHFNSIVENKEYRTDSHVPLLTINNVLEFNKVLIEYVMKEYEILKNPIFYDKLVDMCGYQESDQIKYIMTIVFYNAREEDFKNPISFLKTRIDFIENNYLNSKYNEFNTVINLGDKEIEVASSLQLPSLETPYVFKSRIKYIENDKAKYYDLPNISYGISNNTAYIYAIQRSKMANDSKKINRFLYKVNKDLVDSDEFYEYMNNKDEDIFYPENITDVTHNSVLALSIFLGILKRENITQIIAVDYLPLRYQSKQEANIRKVNLLKVIYNEQEIENKISDFNDIQNINQNNMTNKFIRTFNRVNYHLNNLNILAFPGEIDNSMHIKINDNRIENHHLINTVYNEIAFAEEKRKK